MTHPAGNLFVTVPGAGETFHPLLREPAFLLEHIVSRGGASPPGHWYDQPQAEWVALLRGTAELEFAEGEIVALAAGDYLHIAAHVRHRVNRTSADAIWLALHHPPPPPPA